MKARLVAVLFVATMISGVAFAGQTDQLVWNQSNIAKLRGLDRVEVEEFVNALSKDDVHKTVGGFTWTDLAGDGRYELVTTLDLSGRLFFEYLAIYERDSSGTIRVQWFPEEAPIGKLSSVIRDLNGDGKKELVIPTLFPPDTYGAGSVSTVWPAIYTLRNGAYVEASSEFGRFYDADVLPQLLKEMAESRAKAGTSGAYASLLVSQTLEKDKILRVLGRDPTAGLDEARDWARSGDPNLARAGAGVLQDIHRKAGVTAREKELPKVVVLRKSSAG